MNELRLPRRPLGGTGLSLTPLGLAELFIGHSWHERKMDAD